MSNFTFLQSDFQGIWDSARRGEALAICDPRACCFYARHTVEQMVGWMFEHDSTFNKPYNTKLVSLLNEPSFKGQVPPEVHSKLDMLRLLGNQAVHGAAPSAYQARQAVKELFHACFWLAAQYGSTGQDQLAGLTFDDNTLEQAADAGSPKTKKQLLELDEKYQKQQTDLSEERAKSASYETEIDDLRQKIASIKAENAKTEIPHDYDEATTRDLFIDLLLREAGWDPDYQEGPLKCSEFEVSGMPNNTGQGFVDYVLWGQNGLPLAVVEAKRAQKDSRAGRQQAKLYADCLEAQYGERPIIFYTNGYEHWIWDDLRYPPRQVCGFLKEEELELAIQRRKAAVDLGTLTINKAITDRPYSEGAIRAITEGMMDQRRKALVVMATGTGKTRMSIALVELLQRANWAKRVLFLADRVSLVNQAVNAFKKHLPNTPAINLVTEKENLQSRVFGSTYPTMMGLIDDSGEAGTKRFGVGHFDLIIIDEAHRSVYQKYRSIFDYFDAQLVGLTATPRKEIHHDTYGLFELPDEDPTFAYDLDEAIEDGHLVPPRLVSVPIRIPREGIDYADLDDEEREAWELLEWDEEVPDRVEPDEINRWLFNIDTVDKVLEHVMTNGVYVEAGQKIGKTIIFAKNHDHAVFIEERFNAHYPAYKGHFARVIDNYESYAQDLINKFSMQKNAPSDAPQIAISVDMLDTGIDVPDAVNLVFFKIIRSKTKFWQMIGRGTRKCEDLFGAGLDKQHFFVFDFCGNFEFFKANPEGAPGSVQETVTTRVFRTRLELLDGARLAVEAGAANDSNRLGEAPDEHLGSYADGIAEILHGMVASMDTDNFVVRQKRRLVEPFQERSKWATISKQEFGELHTDVAKLPTQQESEPATAKYFDLLMLRIQLGVLQKDPGIRRLITRVMELAVFLEGLESIPDVARHMVLIQEIQTDEYWEGATLPQLEVSRKNLRNLIQHIEKRKRKPMITDVEDTIGDAEEVELSEVGVAVSLDDYKKRFERFIKEHEDHTTLQKVKLNSPLSPSDLDELDNMLFESSELGSREDFETCYGKQGSLAMFLRTLVGLDREAAKAAFGEYLDTTTFSSEQIYFIDQIIDYLTRNGVMDPKVIFNDAPFTVISPGGPTVLFSEDQTKDLVTIINSFEANLKVA